MLTRVLLPFSILPGILADDFFCEEERERALFSPQGLWAKTTKRG